MPTSGIVVALGKGAGVSGNGTFYPFVEWVATLAGDPIDLGNFKSAGHGEGSIGFDEVQFRIQGPWDVASDYHDAAGFYPRDDGTSLILWCSVALAIGWAFPLYRIFTVENTFNAKQGGMINLTGASQGTYSIPNV